jgi:plastocyanin
MHPGRRVAIAAGIALLLVGGIAAAACEGTEDFDPTPVTTFQITPAAGGGTASTPAGEETPLATPGTQTQTASDGTPGAGTTIELVGINNEFDPEEITVPAGAVTIVFDNQDGGVVHNVHVFRGEDDEGEDVGETELEPGPVVQELELTLEAGDYFFQCDAHPTTMAGSITAE